MISAHPISDQRISRSPLCGRNGLRACAFGLILLGVCVFAWGLKYKLSLYDSPHAPSDHIAVAKLLVTKEQTPAPVVDLRQSPWPGATLGFGPLVVVFFVLLGARLWPGLAGSASESPGRAAPLDLLLGAFCFNRPPPRSALIPIRSA